MRTRQVLGLGLTALAVAGCSSSGDRPTLHAIQHGGDNGVGAPSTKLGTSLIFQLAPLCTTGGAVKIKDVTASGSTGGLKVTSWGVRHLSPTSPADYPAIEATVPGSAESIKGFSPDNPVRVKCSDKDPDTVDQFVISAAASTKRGTMKGVTIHYGDGKTEFAQLDVAVCTYAACDIDGY